jgi:signal transduction histidine kinase/CheY-like chemotaxis protein
VRTLNGLTLDSGLFRPRLAPLLRLLFTACLLSSFAFASNRLNQISWGIGDVTILWPSNAFLLGMLLCSPRRFWASYAAVAGSVDVCMNLSLGNSFPISLYITSCNLFESLLAATLLYRTISPKPDLTQQRQFGAFFAFGIFLSPALASCLVSFALSGHFRMPDSPSMHRWFAADSLGMAMIVPLCLAFHRKDPLGSRTRLEIAGLFALLGSVSVLVFRQTSYPLLFLIMPFLLLLGARLGLAGSALGLLMVSIVGGYYLLLGRGPLELMHQNTMPPRVLVLQVFVATCMLILYILDIAVYEKNLTERKLSEEAKRAGRAAEEASRAKGLFLANMSHEIRTPLNGVIGMTDLVLDTELTADQRDCLETARRSSDHLLTVINDILDFSKIEAGKIDLEFIPFDLSDLVHETLKTFVIQAGAKGLELLCAIAPEVPVNVVGDSGRLRQIILNLIGNALKFTQQGEVELSLEVESLEGSRSMIRFTVRDTGTGIPQESQQSIFLPFNQADTSTTRVYGGTGLGLTISCRLAAMMGGRLWLESEPGYGTQFFFTVQLGVPAVPVRSAPSPAEQSRPLEGFSILVVDDNASCRRILEEMLRGWGATTRTVGGGPQALKELAMAHASETPYSTLIADTHMPGMDGLTLVERLRGTPVLREIPVVMLQAGGLRADATRCRDLGVVTCLPKPVRRSDLLAALLELSATPADVPAAPETLPALVAERVRPLRMLLAEDNRVNQALATRVLQKRGHHVTLANNGQEALALIEEQAFDLILMDIQMPVVDGITATRVIRKQERGTDRHIPIVAMTAHAMKGDRERSLEAGMDGYVSKPITAASLDAALVTALESAGHSA